MKYKNFLVTAANGDLAEAVSGLLRDAFPEAKIHGADAGGPLPGALYCDTAHSLPLASKDEYPAALTQLARQLEADLILPCSEAELLRLAKEPGIAEKLPLLMNTAELLLRFTDKLQTARWLEQNDLPAPRTVRLGDAKSQDLPLIVKPIHGSGSRGVSLVESAAHLSGLQAAFSQTHVAQEYLPDAEAEYTCAILRVPQAIRVLILKRKLAGGRTVSATVVDDVNTTQMLCNLAQRVDLHGMLNVQLRMTSQGPKIFEINPRISSTVKMRHLMGFQDLVWLIQHRAGQPLPDFVVPAGRAVYRLSKEIVAPQPSADSR